MNIKYTTLARQPHLYKDTIELIEDAFQYEDQFSFDIDFSPLMNQSNHEHNHIIIDDGKVVGHIGVQLKFLSLAETPICLIGGIALAKSYRGKGLFTPFFKNVLKEYKDKSALFLLWSDLEPMYEKFGFYQAGGIIQTGSNIITKSEAPSSFSKSSWKELNSKEKAEIKNLYTKCISDNFLTIKRTEKDWNNIFNISSTDLYVKYSNEEISSYFLVNKGQDLENIIHEFAYKDTDKTKIISELDQYQLWLPEIENKKYNLDTLSYCAFFKISNLNLFKVLFNKWSNGSIEILDIEHGFVRFNLNEQLHELSHQDFLLSTFGPNPVEEFEHMGKPLFVCGVDSI